MSYQEFLSRINEFVGYVVEITSVWAKDGSFAGNFQRYVWDEKEFGEPAKDSLMKPVSVKVIMKVPVKKQPGIQFV